ncbi:MAG: hypothetical protein M3440_02195 [Chloroflexota bacterium]|nr:hypothetical protein [Chloroflexota bacterium]
MTYTASRHHETIITDRATSVEDAARVIARKLYGRRAATRRVTGTPGMLGYFQDSLPLPTGGQTSAGSGYHVTEGA